LSAQGSNGKINTMEPPFYLSLGDIKTRLDKFQIHYGGGSEGLAICPSIGREQRWGLARSQIENDYKNGFVTEEEYKWAEHYGLLRKEYSLTN